MVNEHDFATVTINCHKRLSYQNRLSSLIDENAHLTFKERKGTISTELVQKEFPRLCDSQLWKSLLAELCSFVTNHDTSLERERGVVAGTPPFPPLPLPSHNVHGDLVAEEDGADAEGGQEEDEPLGVHHVRAAVAVAAPLEQGSGGRGRGLIVARHALTFSGQKPGRNRSRIRETSTTLSSLLCGGVD